MELSIQVYLEKNWLPKMWFLGSLGPSAEVSLQCDFFSGVAQIFRAGLLDSGVSLLGGVLQVWAGYFGWVLVFVWDGAFFFWGGGCALGYN